MRKLLSLVAVGIFVVSLTWVSDSFAGHGGKKDSWIYKGVELADDSPGVKHYIWETARPPYGPFDKVALHRFIYEPHNKLAVPCLPARDKRKVLFIIPGTWDRGAPKGSDPTVSETYFFASNGYDVYSIEFRTGYIIPNLAYEQFESFGYGDALRATADWTYAAFREDIKACVEKAKSISHARKIFLAGRSRGGTQMYIYAAKYWKKDLKGLIGLDGGGIYLAADNPALQKTEAQFLAAVQAFKNGLLPPPLDKFLSEVSGYEQSYFAGAVPFAQTTVGGPLPDETSLPFGPPPDGSTIDTVSDLVAYGAYWSWGAGLVTNYYTPYPGGAGETYMDREVLVGIESNFTRYWPRIQDLEASFMTGYSNCPFLDYDDTSDIDIPVIFFGSELGCHGGSCLSSSQPYKVASQDVTIVYLEGYGHLDVYAGTHSLEDVKEPVLTWMNDRLGRR